MMMTLAIAFNELPTSRETTMWFDESSSSTNPTFRTTQIQKCINHFTSLFSFYLGYNLCRHSSNSLKTCLANSNINNSSNKDQGHHNGLPTPIVVGISSNIGVLNWLIYSLQFRVRNIFAQKRWTASRDQSIAHAPIQKISNAQFQIWRAMPKTRLWFVHEGRMGVLRWRG